ncbi:LADA_0E00936g1_1 [Lachancea dasiensis]|uniref:LADA_0E00936g1_1 n=1 Tax=Lachancea dasiensis TaxID=1072105 RepID=A0A1G4JA64_9SACH|nr:LADA_0E00936g1_1 [Lachancea dasiensis]
MITWQILLELEQDLLLPLSLISCEKGDSPSQFKCKLKYGTVPDAAMLDCKCIVSEKLFEDLQNYSYDGKVCCPVCLGFPTSMVGPIWPLRTLFEKLQYYKRDQQQGKATGDSNSIVDKASTFSDAQDLSQPQPQEGKLQEKQNLISLFHTIASSVNDSDEEDVGDLPSIHSLDNVSNSKTVPIQDPGSVPVSLPIEVSPAAVQLSQLDEEKEFYFAKCFPMYRKRTQINTHNKFLRAKSKQFVNTAISPDCSKFALITENKWEVYQMPIQSERERKSSEQPQDVKKRFNLASQPKKERMGPNESVTLLFCGKSTGEYGPTFETLRMPSNLSSLHSSFSKREPSKPPKGLSSMAMGGWEHLSCVMSNDLLIIAGTKGRFRVFDLNCGGMPIYTYESTFPIRCIDVDSKGSLIACGITGNDRTTGAEQALILFHQIERESSTSMTENPNITPYSFFPPITTMPPYRDPINTLQFSPDGAYVSCSTALESRFLVISLRKVREPRLVMKSLRSIDTSLESEGITDCKMFPGNSSLMCVTSVAFNAPPIVINTRIQAINVVQSIAQPTMLLRLDELGSKIHKCEISPRNDSIAFLDRNGNVSIMYAPTLLDNEKRRIVLVDAVANASRVREAASMKFSADGHKLYILDRKGSLYIEDFAFALPQNHEVTKCKQVN